MRILMIVPQAFYTTRGTPLSAYHRTRELLRYGHEVDILTYPVGGEPPELDVRLYRSVGPHFASEIKAGPSKIKIWFDCLLFGNLIYRLLRTRYDLLYTHEEAAFLARLLKPVFRIPYVYDMHSSLPLQITDWKFSDSRRVVQLFEWIERQCVTHAAATVAISPSVEEAALQASPEAKTVVIVNHFETSTTASRRDGESIRERYGIAASARVVLYTGSFVALQKLDMLIESIPAVVETCPDAKFLIVGGKPEEIGELEGLAEALGVTSHVILVASRPQEEMPAFMQACDVLVSPRIQGINPPGKLFAYLESLKPVVATDCLVHNQLISDECAILTKPDATSFANGIIRALTDDEHNEAIAAGARQFLAEYCSPAARRKSYERLLSYLET